MDNIRRCDVIREELSKCWNGFKYNKSPNLYEELELMYKKVFKGIVSKKKVLDIKYPKLDSIGIDKSRYNVTLNVNGLAKVDKNPQYSWKSEFWAYHLTNIREICEYLKILPDLSEYLPGDAKKQMYKLFVKNIKNWVFVLPSRRGRYSYYGEELVFNKEIQPIIEYKCIKSSDWRYGIDELKNNKILKRAKFCNRNYESIPRLYLFKDDNTNTYYEEVNIDFNTAKFSLGDKLILAQLPEDVIKELEDYVETTKSSVGNNEKVLEKLKEDLNPYLWVREL